MDFVHEANNAARAVADFSGMNTPLYIPEVLYAAKRVLIMEYIQGARVDDLEYLAKHNIDRNRVSIEISRIFNQMLFLNGWFHAVGGSLSKHSLNSRSSRTLIPETCSFVLLHHNLNLLLTLKLSSSTTDCTLI